MKRILFTITIILFAVSCRKAEVTSDHEYEESSETAVFTFTPSFIGIGGDPETKVMAATPNVQEIYFAVFDNETKRLVEYVPAVLNSAAIQDSVLYSYNVELKVSEKPRIVHIIGNGPSSVSYGSETEVMGAITTSFNENTWTGDDAYWQKMVMEDGIWAMPDPATATTDTAYNTKFKKYKKVVEQLSQARLVRNFVKITVVSSAENFTLSRFWVTNIPDVGSIAPYNRNTNEFQADYNKYKSIFEVRGTGPGEANYQGYTPATADIITISGKTESQLQAIQIDAVKGFTTYVYEREIPEANPLYVIIGGYFGEGNTTEESFYKVDIRDDEGLYFPILRNFDYRVNVRSVSQKGASTVEGALNGIPSGEISTNLDMQGVTNISNGISQIFVSETERVLVGTSTSTDDIILRYKYIPDLTVDTDGDGNADVCNDVSTEDADHSDLKPYVTINSTHGASGEVFSSWDVAPYDDIVDDYRVITMHPVPASAAVKTEILTITGHVYNKEKKTWETLSRTVNYQLREKLNMTLTLSPDKVPNQTGEKLALSIKLPAGLPTSIFSLPLTIESEHLTITPDSNTLPVSTGPSTIPGSTNRSAFMFTKAIAWEDYIETVTQMEDGIAYKEFICYFKTNSNSVAEDNIYVSNEYFNQAHVGYTEYVPKTFSELSITPGSLKIGDLATFSFKLDGDLPADGKVQIGVNGFEPDISETGLTYAGPSSDGQWELYDLPISTTVGNSVALVPYRSGECSVAVVGDEYTLSSASAEIAKGDIEIWADISGTVSDAENLISTTSPKAGSLISGQSSALTIYMSVSGAVNPKLGAMSLNQVTGKTYILNGTTMYAYTTTTNYSAASSKVEELSVSVDGKVVGSIAFPIYSITVNTGSEITDKNLLTSGYIIWRNRDYNGNQYLDGTNNSLTLKNVSSLSLYSLFSVTSTAIRCYMSGRYLLLANNSATLSSTSSSVSINQQSTTGDNAKSFRVKSASYNYYLRISSSSGNVTASNSTTNSYWYAYQAVFKAPSGWTE